MNTQLAGGEIGYLYCTTHIPTGLMYFGSRKRNPDGDPYKGSPRGSNPMRKLFKSQPDTEFEKEVLFSGEYEDVLDMEPLLIKEAWSKFGKHTEGGSVTNMAAAGKCAAWNEETLKLISEGSLRRSEEISGYMTGNQHSLGVKRSEEWKESLGKRKSKPVINWRTAQVWSSGLGADKDLGLNKGTIQNRISQGCDGGVWQVIGSPKPLTDQGTRSNLKKAVVNIETGEEYESVKAAIEQTGISKATIHRHMRGATVGPWRRKADLQTEND